MRAYNKPALHFDQQLEKLKSRGLGVADESAALHQLATISYYRLSGYWYPFRQISATGERLNNFKPNTSFAQIIQLYDFDRELRSLVLQAIEHVEIAARTQITYHFGHAYGAFGHTISGNFHSRFSHQAWLAKLESEIGRSKDKFIQHYRNNYNGFPRLPIWMATEVLSLGSLSFFYKGLNNADKRAIADFFDLHPKRLQNWLHALTYVRNVCAHHSRLWNRDLAIRPGKIKEPNWCPPVTPTNDRIFYVLLIIRHLLQAIGSHDKWRDRVNQLASPITAIPAYRKAMGMSEGWQNHPLWR